MSYKPFCEMCWEDIKPDEVESFLEAWAEAQKRKWPVLVVCDDCARRGPDVATMDSTPTAEGERT